MRLDFHKASQILSYDRDTGELTWKVTKGRAVKGRPAGWLGGKYKEVKIDGFNYKAHRIAWLLTYGKWPDDQVDHIDGNKQNNKLSNLRAVSNKENAHNRHKVNNPTGLLGVKFNGKRFEARIVSDGNFKHLGTFDNADDAHQAYLDAKKYLHQGVLI